MKFKHYLGFCALIILTGSSQTRGQSSAPVPPPSPTNDPGHEVPQLTPSPTGPEETSSKTTTSGSALQPETVKSSTIHTLTTSFTEATHQQSDVPLLLNTNATTASPSAPGDSLSATPTAESSTSPQSISTAESRSPLTTEPLTTFSSPSAHTAQGTSSTTHASTIQQQPESLATASTQAPTTALPLTSAPGQGPARPTHKEVPSELNVGDEDHKRPRSNSPLDPLLAGLLSVFIVTTAIVFVILFLKFRQRTNHPEFHRLQDLPMDDLMEDTPLSRYSY